MTDSLRDRVIAMADAHSDAYTKAVLARTALPDYERTLALAVAALVAKESALAMREKCAQVCTARVMGDGNREDQEARRCAAAIRGIEP